MTKKRVVLAILVAWVLPVRRRTVRAGSDAMNRREFMTNSVMLGVGDALRNYGADRRYDGMSPAFIAVNAGNPVQCTCQQPSP